MYCGNKIMFISSRTQVLKETRLWSYQYMYWISLNLFSSLEISLLQRQNSTTYNLIFPLSIWHKMFEVEYMKLKPYSTVSDAEYLH